MTAKKSRIMYSGKDHSRSDIGERDTYFTAGDKLKKSSEKSYGIEERSRQKNAPKPFHVPVDFSQEEKTPTWFKKIISLKTDRGREKEDQFLMEGTRCVKDVLEHTPDAIMQTLYTVGYPDTELLEGLRNTGTRVECLQEVDFKEVSTTVNGQGILVVCRAACTRPNWETARYVTLIDGVQDPGNLGAIFRTSLGFGMDAIVMGKGTVDPFNPKVVRGSSGTMLRMPFEAKVDLAERILFLQNKGFTVLATSPHAETDIADVKLRKKVAFLIGNEGRGAEAEYIDMANAAVRIDTGSVESLNVSVAHGILCHKVKESRSK